MSILSFTRRCSALPGVEALRTIMLALITAIHNQIHFPHCFVNRYKRIPSHGFSLPTVFTCAVVLGDGRGWKGRIKRPPKNSQDFPRPSSFLLQTITGEGVVQNLCKFCLRMWRGPSFKARKGGEYQVVAEGSGNSRQAQHILFTRTQATG